MVLRGSVPVDKIGELFGVPLETAAQHSNVTTIAGLLNSVAGHVPRTGEVVEFDGLRFEVLEANQRKVLRVRARRARRRRRFQPPARCEKVGRVTTTVICVSLRR